jgi:hypothetical protein
MAANPGPSPMKGHPMKNGITLVDLAQRITATHQAARDFVVPAAKLAMSADAGGGVSLNLSTATEGHSLSLAPIAHEQIATHLDIPRAYYDRCRASDPGLLATNVNAWLARSSDKRTVRTVGTTARAFLSDRYRALDNFDLAQCVLPILADGGLRVESCELTERRFYLKAVNPKVQGDVGVGDIVQAGVCISNSEVGHGSLSISPLVYKLSCKNGMIVADQSLRKYHTGDKRAKGQELENAIEIYSDATRQKMDAALWSQVRDLTSAALNDALFQQIVAKMRAAKEGTTVKHPEVAVEVLRSRFTLTEKEGSDILAHLCAGGDLSRFGVLNAVTRMAQDVESYDRSTDLEKLGGTILDMAAKDWATLAG